MDTEIDIHTDVVTTCLTQYGMCVTNITSLECNPQAGNITRTIEGTISAGDVNNSSMYIIKCWPPVGDKDMQHFFYQDYIVTNSSQCTNGSSDISIATVTVTTTVTECSLDFESSYISFPSLFIIPSPSLLLLHLKSLLPAPLILPVSHPLSPCLRPHLFQQLVNIQLHQH